VAVEDTPDGPRWTLSGSAPTEDLTSDDPDDVTTDEVQ
jgi:hypothetical protein